MSILSWGKPTVEIAVLTGGTPGAFSALPEIQQDTAKLTPTKGTALEAKGEGGKLIDKKYQANQFVFECEIFVKKGDTRPISDNDGVVADNYAVRLTPEDETQEGFILDKSLVSIEETWASNIGKKLKLTFEGLSPASGNILKPYTKSTLAVSPTSLSFTNAADSTGKTITASSTGNITAARSDKDWATVTYALKVATVKVSANANTDSRTASITITADGKTVVVVVTQAGA